MRKEIGSEFWNIPLTKKDNKFFPTNTKWFLSGRNALFYLIEIISKIQKIHSVGIPSWCCDSIIQPFMEFGIDIVFYPITFNEKLVQNLNSVMGCDVILIMDFFGYITDLDINEYSGIVIRDITHSLFSIQYHDADYYFGSLRKWAGFWTGGYIWSEKWNLPDIPITIDKDYIILRKSAMTKKNAYIKGFTEEKEYLNDFYSAEEYLNAGAKGQAANRDVRKTKMLDIDYIRNQHRINAGILTKHFNELAMFKEIKDIDCPMFVPIYVPESQRDALQKYFIAHEMYFPVHWPITSRHRITENERKIYTNEKV